MAKIYWRNGWAWARAQVKGQERREPLGTTSARVAEERFQQWIVQVAGEKDARWGGQRAPYEHAVECFLEHHVPNLKPKSQARYATSLLALTPHFKGIALQEIGKKELAQFVSERRKDGVTTGTIRRDLACLSSVFTIATDFELVDSNPVLAFMRTQKRRGLVEAPPRQRYLSHTEEALLLERAHERYRLQEGKASGRRAHTSAMILSAIAVAIDTGLREEEQLGLLWSDVDLARNEIRISPERAKNKTGRAVPLLPRARRVIEALPRCKGSEFVFWHRTGQRFVSLNQSLKELAGIARQLGPKSRARFTPKKPSAPAIPDLRWHDLRRTCGCRLLQDHRMPIEEVSHWLGHTTVGQTQRAYAFLTVDQLHDTVNTSYRTNAGTPALEISNKLLVTMPFLDCSVSNHNP